MDLEILADVVCRACRIELLRNPDALLRRRERKQLLVGMPRVGPRCAVRFTRERGRRFNDLIHSDRVAMRAERSAFWELYAAGSSLWWRHLSSIEPGRYFAPKSPNWLGLSLYDTLQFSHDVQWM